MAKRDPHDVLGVRLGAGADAVKAAWRRLARQHHPDLTGDDPAASRIATRLMAEINDAYEALRRADLERRAGIRAAGGTPSGRGFDEDEPARGRTGPPRPKPSRPVTGRLDTSDTFRPRNATTGRGRSGLAGQTVRRSRAADREPPRASDPNGPLERGRIHRFRRAPAPSLADARAHEVGFGKFRGHTLGDIAAFEPSYIDWLAKTITTDRDLIGAARVLQDDLDGRGVVRRVRPDRAPAGRSA